MCIFNQSSPDYLWLEQVTNEFCELEEKLQVETIENNLSLTAMREALRLNRVAREIENKLLGTDKIMRHHGADRLIGYYWFESLTEHAIIRSLNLTRFNHPNNEQLVYKTIANLAANRIKLEEAITAIKACGYSPNELRTQYTLSTKDVITVDEILDEIHSLQGYLRDETEKYNAS